MTAVSWPLREQRQVKTADGQPVSMDSFFIALGKRLDLAGFGEAAITDAQGDKLSLHRAEDFYLRAAANLAFTGETLGEATADDIAFAGLERLLPELETTLPQEERGPVARLYSRGGRYERFDAARQGDRLGNAWTRELCIWNED